VGYVPAAHGYVAAVKLCAGERVLFLPDLYRAPPDSLPYYGGIGQEMQLNIRMSLGQDE
jgi:hypothetical protein